MSGRFVIHKHDASTLHYDLRLEVDGVLKSWAVPKGPSTDPRVKRLAVEVDDHRLEYGDFEGVIEEGYGEGTVIAWDRGRYRPLDTDRSMAEALAAGHAAVWLEGEKLTGGWTLQRTRAGDKPQWLLIKRRDEGADARRNPQSTQPESVKTGRTVEQVAGQRGGVSRWVPGAAGTGCLGDFMSHAADNCPRGATGRRRRPSGARIIVAGDAGTAVDPRPGRSS